MAQMASSNTVLQTLTSDEKRGRVMSFYSMAFQGMVPMGALLSGVLAASIGAPGTVILGGACCLLGSIAFSLKLPELRAVAQPIYVERDILPEISRGMELATESRLSAIEDRSSAAKKTVSE